ncbi:ROK family transcriptional regulator [Pelomonas cellulosilytica]|uniref:ROK family transcriptional regulator n=1 Tax=Pelomonas cellulosilytica TaxID=2906762 RepID=A0ABS8XZ93_9BURK|nr:ROK family transcriptional regulator [Pelomonas sp. P8]MCE4555936.1 ROK family transcriptional regulator [Pelomonas sp. P8]
MNLDSDEFRLRDISAQAVLRLICAEPGQSRGALADALSLPRPTVIALVRKLLDQGWLQEHAGVEAAHAGRRSALLHLRRDRLVLLGAEVGDDGVRVLATSLTGDVLARLHEPCACVDDAEAMLARAARLLLGAHARVAALGRSVVAIGAGLAGRIDEFTGCVSATHPCAWAGVPVARRLGEHLRGTPLQRCALHVQGGAQVAGVGELEFGVSRPRLPLLSLWLGERVEAALVGDGPDGPCRLLPGLAHMTLSLDGTACRCGRRGCVEAMVGLRAMILPGEAASMVAVTQRLGEADAARAVERAGRHLGVVLGNLWMSHDPGRIVVAGPAASLGAPLLAPALAALAEQARVAGRVPPEVTVSRFGDEAVALGAAAFARYRLTRPLRPPSRLTSLFARYGYRYHPPSPRASARQQAAGSLSTTGC